MISKCQLIMYYSRMLSGCMQFLISTPNFVLFNSIGTDFIRQVSESHKEHINTMGNSKTILPTWTIDYNVYFAVYSCDTGVACSLLTKPIGL